LPDDKERSWFEPTITRQLRCNSENNIQEKNLILPIGIKIMNEVLFYGVLKTVYPQRVRANREVLHL